MSQTPVDQMSFEQAMAELEQVVGQLERGDVALEQSIQLYERDIYFLRGSFLQTLLFSPISTGMGSILNKRSKQLRLDPFVMAGLLGTTTILPMEHRVMRVTTLHSLLLEQLDGKPLP